MKKYLSPLLIVLLFSCKKSGDGTSNTLLMAEIYRNGHLDNQYLWSADKDLLRFNEFSVSGNQSNLSLYVLYEYGPDGNMKHRKVFTPNDTLNNRYELMYDNGGRLSRMDWYFPGNTLYNYRLYEYDQEDRMKKVTEKKGGTNDNIAYTEYTYDEEGRMINSQRFSWATDKWRKTQDHDYMTTGKNVYEHWQKFMSMPTDMYVNELTMASKRIRLYTGDGDVGTDYKDSATNKKYNGSGYLVSQTITRYYTKPVQSNVVWELEYIYLQ